MAYLIYNLSYKGQKLDFNTITKDHRQAIFDAVSVVFDEMEIKSRSAGHPSRYQLSTERDLSLMSTILPDIGLKLVETIGGEEELSLDWGLKLLAEYKHIRDAEGHVGPHAKELEVEIAQGDYSLKRMLDRRFCSQYHTYTQSEKDLYASELDQTLQAGWLLIKRVHAV